jgi:hypothetical protein
MSAIIVIHIINNCNHYLVLYISNLKNKTNGLVFIQLYFQYIGINIQKKIELVK